MLIRADVSYPYIILLLIPHVCQLHVNLIMNFFFLKRKKENVVSFVTEAQNGCVVMSILGVYTATLVQSICIDVKV